MAGWVATLMETVIGYLLVVIYAQRAWERVTNGLYPPALLGALLQLIFGARLLWLFWRDYGNWCAGRSSVVRGRLLIGWGASAALGALLSWNAYWRYIAQLPEQNGSLFRFYFGTWELWLLVIAAAGFFATLRHRVALGRIDRGGGLA